MTECVNDQVHLEIAKPPSIGFNRTLVYARPVRDICRFSDFPAPTGFAFEVRVSAMLPKLSACVCIYDAVNAAVNS